MDPKIWGPPFWRILYDCCKLVDTQEKTLDIIPELAESIRWALPCSECRASFTLISLCVPPSEPYLEWIWKIRNIVNQKLQCPQSEFLPLDAFLEKAKNNKRFSRQEDVKTTFKIVVLHFTSPRVPSHHICGVERFLCILMKCLSDDLLPVELRELKDKNLFSKGRCNDVTGRLIENLKIIVNKWE